MWAGGTRVMGQCVMTFSGTIRIRSKIWTVFSLAKEVVSEGL